MLDSQSVSRSTPLKIEHDYSPRLYNKDLAPAENQNWNWFNILTFWISDVHSLGGYLVASSLFSLGLQGWQVLVSLLAGILVVQIGANLMARPSQLTGVPYSVICRQAFGVFGANIPAVIRGIIALAWYGIQTYLTANAMMLVILKLWPDLILLTHHSLFGLSHLGWICFIVMWCLQALVFWRGMNTIKHFIKISGPAIYTVMLILAGWILYQTGLKGISFSLSDKSLSSGQQLFQMITASALVVSYFSGPLLNFGDFARYGKSNRHVQRGNFWGLPINFLMFSLVAVMIVSGAHSLYGRMITNPMEILDQIDSKIAVAIGLLTMIIATIGINIVANFVSPAFDFSNCAPQKISFRTGGLIAAVGSVLLTPWNLFNSPALIHYTLDILSVFVGPLFGILLTDFYLIKRGQVSVRSLFDDAPKSEYWYRNGFNPKAITALALSLSIGLMIMFIPQLKILVNFSWFIGVLTGVVFYFILARNERQTLDTATISTQEI
mgnify:CR=1 FL=1